MHILDVKSDEEKLRIDVADEEMKDFRMGLVSVCYNFHKDDVVM